MNLSNLRLSLRLLSREWRAGELRLFAAALVIAVAAVTAVGVFADRLGRGLGQRTAELLGADLALITSNPAAADKRAEAERLGLARAEAIEFPSVALAGERLQLAAVRAVSAGYPLRGALRTAAQVYGDDVETAGIPEPGTAWAEARLLGALEIAPGDELRIGNASFRIARVLTHEPGRGGNFFAMAPRVLIGLDDVVATGVLQPGSRVTYAYGFAGQAPAIAAYREWLTARLAVGERILGAGEGNEAVSRSVTRVERFLGLTSLLAVLLAGIAIAMAARRYTERHLDTSALLRCLGASKRKVLAVHVPQLAAVGLIAGALGVAIGGLFQMAVVNMLSGLVPFQLPAPGVAPFFLGLASGLIALGGFALPPLLRLGQVPPLRVLRRDLSGLPASAWMVYGAAAAALAAVAWPFVGSATLLAGVAAGGVVAAVLLALLAYALLAAARRLERQGGAWRFALGNLWRRRRATLTQMLAFGFALMAMTLVLVVRNDLLDTWQKQLPANTPNHFAFNITPAELPEIQRFLGQRGVAAGTFYPMVRGRLTAIDGVPVTKAVTKEDVTDDITQRDLNLTWSSVLPPTNRIVEGQWWAEGSKEPLVSVEERLAQKFDIRPGRSLTFVIGGVTLEARVASLRKVQWDSFQPNYYMIFPPGLLDGQTATHLTSFFLTPEQKPLLAELVRAYPSVTVLETDRVIAEVRGLLAQVTLAVEGVLGFVLAAGLAVLFAALNSTLDERRQEGALLRTFGATSRQLRAGQLAEFALLGGLAGLLAALGTELISWGIYTRVLSLEYAPTWKLWLGTPLAGALLLAAAGHHGMRSVRASPPISVLREL